MIVSTSIQERLKPEYNIQETYSSPLVNYTEPRKINGVNYTRFFTKVNTELNVGDYVYILNGNYDNSDLIEENEYQKGSTGYKVLEIDRTSITLDIIYRDEDVWNNDPIEDYTKVYVVDNLDKFNYENTDNGFAFEAFAGVKFSDRNNNIFLSKIEDLPYTSETNTKNRFFKSYYEALPNIVLDNTRGQLFTDNTTLNFDLDEIEIYGADQTNGASGSSFMSFSTNYNYIKDFIIWDKIERTTSNEINSLITLNSTNQSNSLNKIWTVDKRSLDANSLSDVTVRDSTDVNSISVTNLNKFTDSVDTTINVKLPIFNDDIVRYYRNSSTPSSYQTLNDKTYDVINLNETIILGDRVSNESVNFRGFSFYNSKNDVSLQFISPDLTTSTWPNLGSITKGYRETSNTDTVPYFALSARNGNKGNYTGDMVFPVAQNLSDVTANIIPPYAEYNGIGKAVRVESNRWFNQEEDSINFELAFAGNDTQTFDELGGGILPDREHGGIYFYSYSGTWVDYTEVHNGGTFLGNAFDMSKTTYDKYINQWAAANFNPFVDLSLESFNQIGDISDIKWIGVEKKELGLRLSLNGSNVQYTPTNEPLPSNSGIYYSKYLVTTKMVGGMGYPLLYYLYINLNGELLVNNPDFASDINEFDVPQVHVSIEIIEPSPNTIISENRENDSYNFPTILDGQYPIGNISGTINEFGIPNNFTSEYDLTNTSVTDMTFHDFRWLVSSSQYSPRLDNYYLGSSSEGIFLYDKSVDNRLSYTEIDSTYNFDIGDDLPSNNVFKIEGETMGNKRRVWAATDQGLFMFDYDFTYEYDYYYRVDVDNNDIPLIDELYKNDKLYIIEDFEYDGDFFEKGKIYKHISNESRWVLDTTYEQPYLTKAHFKEGEFSTISKFNDGIYGSKETEAVWENGTWRNGILFNSTWQSGTMLSKSDEQLEKNYYTTLSNGKIKISTDFENNNGYGYNLIKDSFVVESQINNSVIEDSIIGSQTSSSLLNATYSNTNYMFNNIDILNGYILNSDIYSSEINNVKVTKSNINSSLVSGNSKLINNNAYDSIIDNAIMENSGDISILDYDRWYNIKNEVDGQSFVHIHKFFIDEKDFEKLAYKDWVIFNNVKLNRNSPSNILDKLFYVLSGEEGFYKDIYEDLDRIKNNNSEYEENDIKVFISKKIATQNVEKTEISYDGTSLVINKVPYSNPMYSIDISIIIDKIPFNSDSDIYRNLSNDDSITKFTVAEVTNSTIQNYHYKNTWINGGEWSNGSIISPDILRSKQSYSTTTSDNSSITLNKYNTDYEIVPDIGNIVYINNIWDTSFGTYSGGKFEVTTNGTQSITLNPYDSFVANSTLTTPLSQYVNLNLNRIDGVNNELVIKRGLFKNQSFSNLTIRNRDIDTTSLDYYNIRNLMLINSEITSRDNVNISNLFFGYSYISNEFIEDQTDIKGLIYRSALYSVDLRDSYVTKSAFLKGRAFNSTFYNNKYNDKNGLIPINTNGYNVSNRSLIPVWHSGNFERGIFENSVWLTGNFLSGRFFDGEFLGGTFYTGIFGDKGVKSSSNLFRKGLWKSGTFENGIFGDNTNRISTTRNIYTTSNHILNTNRYIKGGINIWELGNFNSGIFSSTNGNVSLWRNGKFNNGSIEDSVIWYDGIFNNGKFKSVYGRHLANVLGEINYNGSSPLNLADEYNTRLSFLNKYNICSIREPGGKEINNGLTLIFNNIDDQVNFIYAYPTSQFNPPLFGSSNYTAHGYTEKLVDDFYNDPVNEDLYLNFRPLPTNGHPLEDGEVIGTKIILQDSGDEYIYNGSEYIDKSTFLGTTMSGTSLTYNSDYAWRKGVFNGGEFGTSDNTNNANPSWEDGVFNGGDFYGKIWKNGKFVKGTFHGKGVEQLNIDNNFPFRGYDPQSTVDKYLDIQKTAIIETNSSSQVNYKVTLDDYNWYGLWLDGEVASEISNNQSNGTNISPALDSLLGSEGSSSGANSNTISQNILLENFNEDKYNRRKQDIPIFDKMLWVAGNFNNTNGIFRESVWLAGTFSNGTLSNSLFNPYVMRWDFDKSLYTNRKFKYELDSDKCIWLNGTFNDGVFYYSDWNNGTFEDGIMVGGHFKSGIANYISAYSTIWETGRFRNGNWYGSNFTIDNIYNNNSIPNVFEYLGRYFENKQYPPFVTDILGNNSRRLQDDRLHIWNSMDGNINRDPFNVNNYTFNNDSFSYNEENAPIGGGPIAIYRANYYLRDETVTTVGNNGIYDLRIGLEHDFGATPSGSTSDITFNIVSEQRYGPGIYELDFYTSGTQWSLDPNVITTLDFELRADIYRDGFKVQSNQLIKEIPNGVYTSVKSSFVVPDNEEYLLKINTVGRFKKPASDKEERILIEVQEVESDISYTSDNNTLNSYLQLNWEGDYLNSNIYVTSSSATYSSKINVENSFEYETLDVVTISVPTNYQNISGAYTQFGNGSFQKGIFENGIWNNGYRGIDYGLYIEESGDTFTYSSGMTANVATNDLYSDNTKYMYRTEPIIYFNDVQRSFKVSNNVWNFVLESAFNVVGDVNDTYNKVIVGDQISISNIIAIDINGNRKLIKGVFNVIGTQNRNRIIVEYEETFPIDTIQIDSDRHLIYVTKNIWYNGAFLNGYFNGIMTNSYIRGNRYITQLEDSHLIDVEFKGGHFKGVKKDLSEAFDNRTNVADALSPQFGQIYNNKYHTALVQYMDFEDDVTVKNYNMDTFAGVSVNGENGEKTINVGPTSSVSALQYIYNSDMDIVYEPEFFSSIFNQTIINSHILGNSKIGQIPTETKMYNIPAGYISNDILDSNSKFKYSTTPTTSNLTDYNLSLGSKYRIYNTIFNADFNESPQNDVEIDKPSTFNIVQSATYGVYVKEDTNGNGIDFGNLDSKDIHEDFMYIYATAGNNINLISGDKSFKQRNRYHFVEVDIQFPDNLSITNPYDIQQSITLTTTYSYGTQSLPKLSIGQSYNEFYENIQDGGETGYLSPYDNDTINFFNGNKLSEINNFGTQLGRLTLKSFSYNNFGGYRDSVKLIEKGFVVDAEEINGTQSYPDVIRSPIYYSFKHYEVDKIPFFNYKDYYDPITATVSEWNMLGNQKHSRKIDDRIKTPFYATSIPINYQDSNFVLTDNINFLGGTNIESSAIVEDIDILRNLTIS